MTETALSIHKKFLFKVVKEELTRGEEKLIEQVQESLIKKSSKLKKELTNFVDLKMTLALAKATGSKVNFQFDKSFADILLSKLDAETEHLLADPT